MLKIIFNVIIYDLSNSTSGLGTQHCFKVKNNIKELVKELNQRKIEIEPKTIYNLFRCSNRKPIQIFIEPLFNNQNTVDNEATPLNSYVLRVYFIYKDKFVIIDKFWRNLR